MKPTPVFCKGEAVIIRRRGEPPVRGIITNIAFALGYEYYTVTTTAGIITGLRDTHILTINQAQEASDKAIRQLTEEVDHGKKAG